MCLNRYVSKRPTSPTVGAAIRYLTPYFQGTSNPNPQTLPQLHILYNTYYKGLKAPGSWGTKAPSYSSTYYSSTYELHNLPLTAPCLEPKSWNPISV